MLLFPMFAEHSENIVRKIKRILKAQPDHHWELSSHNKREMQSLNIIPLHKGLRESHPPFLDELLYNYPTNSKNL